MAQDNCSKDTFNTLDNVNRKIMEKINLVKQSIESINNEELLREINKLFEDYQLLILSVMTKHYLNETQDNFKEFNRILSSNNIIKKIDHIIIRTINHISNGSSKYISRKIINKQANIISDCKSYIEHCDKCIKAIACTTSSKKINEIAYLLKKNNDYISSIITMIKEESSSARHLIINMLTVAKNIDIKQDSEKVNFDICDCGYKMNIVPEISELHCSNPSCGKTTTIVGTVFKYEQSSYSESNRNKYNGYDPSQHYKIWMDRILGNETKTISEDDIKKIEFIINRDKWDLSTLTCKDIRRILKDSKVKAQYLNDHTPYLLRRLTGKCPPRLSLHDERKLSYRFDKAMHFYDQIVTKGKKPYYPYFIYKLIEHEFKDDKDKLRLLDNIHLQSRETVVKNDRCWKIICELADDEEDFVYKPTDPAGRL